MLIAIILITLLVFIFKGVWKSEKKKKEKQNKTKQNKKKKSNTHLNKKN